MPVKISLHQNKKKPHGPLSAGILQGLHERHYYLNNCSYNKHFVNIFSIVYPNIWSLMLSLPQIVMNIEKSYNILLLNFKRWRTIVNNKKKLWKLKSRHSLQYLKQEKFIPEVGVAWRRVLSLLPAKKPINITELNVIIFFKIKLEGCLNLKNQIYQSVSCSFLMKVLILNLVLY